MVWRIHWLKPILFSGRRFYDRLQGRSLRVLVGFWACLLLCLSFPLSSVGEATELPALSLESRLPLAQVHPLPDFLAEWRHPEDSGDYFSEIQPTPLGYLIWSQFPVKVFVESLDDPVPGQDARRSQWIASVTSAIQEWNAYIPLVLVHAADEADISIWSTAPSLSESGLSREDLLSGNYRVRSAETRYKFELRDSDQSAPVLVQRFDVFLSPSQTATYTQASARHEIGHALGIWGHSQVQTDALYFAQTANPAGVSVRDINTLKRIYEQPTRLGWALRD